MLGEWVVDASLLGAAFFRETETGRARARLLAGGRFIAPDLLHVEIASLAAKKVRRGDETLTIADAALAQVPGLLDETVPAAPYSNRAFQLAAEFGLSAYDGLYLAIAEDRGLKVLTLDERLIRRSVEAGLAHLVEAP